MEDGHSDCDHEEGDHDGDDKVCILEMMYREDEGYNNGAADIFAVDGKRSALAQHAHCKYRGSSLGFLSFYEYCALVVIKPRNASTTTADAPAMPHRGR